MKICAKCKVGKTREEFHKNRASKDGLYAYCKNCKNADNKAWKQANPEKHRENGRKWREKNGEVWKWTIIKSKYGITKDQYEAFLVAQEGLCAVCRKAPGEKGFHIDHDHSCCAYKGSCGKCVRGLLCFSCNAGIGMLSDDVDLLMSAISYISASRLTMDDLGDTMVV